MEWHKVQSLAGSKSPLKQDFYSYPRKAIQHASTKPKSHSRHQALIAFAYDNQYCLDFVSLSQKGSSVSLTVAAAGQKITSFHMILAPAERAEEQEERNSSPGKRRESKNHCRKQGKL